jgi:prolipoprotein diacylglyceryltransferase
MLTDKFDAFGEVLPDAPRDQRAVAKAGSAALSRIGQYAFWLFVIVIIAARVIYYPVNPASTFVSTSESNIAATR